MSSSISPISSSCLAEETLFERRLRLVSVFVLVFVDASGKRMGCFGEVDPAELRGV